MTKEEWSLLVKVVKSAYPNQTFCPDNYSLELYYRMLHDIPYGTLNLAIQRHIATNRYPPSISELRGCMAQKTDWSEGWEEVKRSMRLYGAPREKEALDSMSPLTRKIVQRQTRNLRQQLRTVLLMRARQRMYLFLRHIQTIR